MSVLENAIRQQEAAVELTRIYVKNKRVPAAELDVAQAKLDELNGMRLREVAAQSLAVATDFSQLVERSLPTPLRPLAAQALPSPKGDIKNGADIDWTGVDEARGLAGTYTPKVETTVTVDDRAEYQVKQPQLAQGEVYRRMQELVMQAKGLENQQVLLADQLRTVPEDQECPEVTEEIAALQGEINATWAEYRFIEQNKKLPEAERIDDDPEREVELLRIARELKSLRDRRLKLEKKLDKPHLHTKNPSEKVPAWGKELLLVESQIAELEFKREAIR